MYEITTTTNSKLLNNEVKKLLYQIKESSY